MKNRFLNVMGVAAWALLMGVAVAGCSSDSEPVVEPYVLAQTDIKVAEPEGGFKAEQDQLFKIQVTSVSDEKVSYEWLLDGVSISKEKNLSYMCDKGGNHELTLKVTQGERSYTYVFELFVAFAPVPEVPEGSSPYITKVLDFCPAPGQFTNKIPEYVEGDTQEVMNQKVLDAIGYNRYGMVSLGGYGGYVVVGFDHTIQNVADKRDFKVLGNAFYAAANPNPNAPKKGGSCEPGVIMVAYDANKNGKPDADEWYEIAGSEYPKPTTIKNYEITYRRNAADHQPTLPPDYDPDDMNKSWMADDTNCPWTDNQGGKGYVPKNIFNPQEYYPQWIKADELKFTGTLLPKNGIDESGKGTYWVLYAFDFGYADNGLNADETSDIDIDWAVDSKGKPVHLPGVDFIKIYTGVNQSCGWLGEVSTEVSGVTDLHLKGKK